jgi:hypothetical protein
VLSSCLIAGSTGAGTRCGHGVGSDSRTSGSATTRGRDLGIAWHCHTVMPQPVGSHPPPRPSQQHHPPAAAGNPDASRSFAGPASDAPVPHGPADRDGSSGSADRPRAGRDISPPVHSRRRNRSGRGRSSCRSAPERGNAHTRTAGPAFPPAQARPHMDGVGNAWNNAPACVLGTVWGTASIRNLAV